MPLISKVMEDRDSFDFRELSDWILLLLITVVHSLEKWELNISVFCVKSVINLLSWETGGIVGIFLLFKNVFNMDQYVLRQVLGSKNLFATFE